MKRILSLFLSMVLIFSMVLSSIVIEALPDTGSTKLVEVAYDSVGMQLGKKYSASYKYFPTYTVDGQETVIDQIHPTYYVFDTTGGEFKLQSQLYGKDNVAKSGYISFYPYSDTTAKATTGRYIITGKFYTDCDKGTSSDAYFNPAFRLNSNGSPKASLTATGLKAYVWYDFEYIVDLYANEMKVSYKAVGSDAYTYTGTDDFAAGTPFIYLRINMTLDNHYKSFDNTKSCMKFKDLRMVVDKEYEKAKITSVGSDGDTFEGKPAIPYGQNKVQFTLDKEIVGLSDAHITVEDGKTVNSAADIDVTSDGTKWIVTATLENDLEPFTDYTLKISKNAWAGYKEVTASGYADVTDITAEFKTKPTPFSSKVDATPDSSGNLTIGATIVNSATGAEPLNAMFIVVKRDENGVVTSVEKTNPEIGTTGDGGKTTNVVIDDFTDGTAEFIMVNSDGLTPIFDGGYTYEPDGTVITESYEKADDSTLSSGEMKIGSCENDKLTVEFNTGSSAEVSGVLYVYDKDSNLKYADFITTADNGTARAEIGFANMTSASGEYTIKFFADGIAIYEDYKMIVGNAGLAEILSVGSDGSVERGEDEVKFVLSDAMPGLSPEDIYVTKSDGISEDVEAVSVTSDGTEYTVTLKEALDGWSTYYLVIKSDYYAEYGNILIDVEDITKEFKTTSDPEDFQVTGIDASGTVTYDAINTLGGKYMQFVYVQSNDGVVIEIASDGFDVNGEIKNNTISLKNFNSDDAYTLKFFAIKSWDNPVLFIDKCHIENPSTQAPEKAEGLSSGEMVLGDYDYAKKEIPVSLNTGINDTVNGVIYVYEKDKNLKDTLIYADYLTTYSDGTLSSYKIKLDAATENKSKEYTVAYYVDGIDDAITADFKIINTDYENLASINYVGSDSSNEVEYGKTQFKFTLSDAAMPELSAEDIYVTKSDGVSENINAVSVTTSDDMTFTVTLEEALESWETYYLVIKSDYYAKYEIDKFNNILFGIEDAVKQFTTTPKTYDIKSIDINDSGLISYDIIASDATPMDFYYINFNADGTIKEIKSDAAVISSAETKIVNLADAISGKAKFFIVKPDANSPVIENAWIKEHGGEITEAAEGIPSDKAKANEMVIDSFDYDNRAVTIHLNAGRATEGVLYIYERNEDLKSTLQYVDYLVTASDGTLVYTAKLNDSIVNSDGEYTVAFYSKNVAKIENDFAVYQASNNIIVNLGLLCHDITDKKLELSGDASRIIRVKNDDGSTTDTFFTQTYRKTAEGDISTSITSDGIDPDNDVIKITNNLNDEGVTDSSYQTKIGLGKTITKGKAYISGRFLYSGNYLSTNMRIHGQENLNGTKSYIERKLYENYGLSALSSGEWYNFEYVIDMDLPTPTVTATYTDTHGNSTSGSVDFKQGSKVATRFSHILLYFYIADGEYMMYDDLKAVYDDGNVEKPIIRFIDTDKDDIVDFNQNEITFKISKDNGLTADDIYVTDSQGNIIKSKSIEKKEDVGEYIITASLEKDLVSWMNYVLNVKAVGYEDYRELDGDGNYVAVTPITRAFSTDNDSFDIKDPVITSDGVGISAESQTNNSGASQDKTLVFAVYGSDGVMTQPVKNEVKAINGLNVSISNTMSEDDTAKLFVINSWSDPRPTFKKSWYANRNGDIIKASAPVASSKAEAGTIALDEFVYNTKFSHADKKIVVNLNTGKNVPTDGVLYVYKDSAMNTGNLPVYVDFVTTAADGTLLKEIKFADTIVDSSAQYTVAFYSEDLEIKNSFNVYNAADYLEYKRQNIYERSANQTTFSGLMQVITGRDENNNLVDDAWTVFSQGSARDADVSVYNALNSKEQVFIKLIGIINTISSYDVLCDKFEEAAKACKEDESKTTPPPSANNKTPGPSSVSMSATPAAGSSNAGASVGGGLVFSDMTGHWGQKYAEALVAKGIVNGYADGSFRGDNPITRAELTKIVVEALDVPEASGAAFGDVNSSSWYADYVSRANASGVVNGFEDGSFRPEANVSRQDAVLMIWRAMNLTAKLPEGYKFFADEKDIQDYASPAIRCLGDLGIITGSDSKFMPLNNITRAEMAAVICRAIDYMESHMQ